MNDTALQAEKKTVQLLLCQSEAQQARAVALFPKLECRYVNGGDWSSVAGRRCVALGEDLAAFAVGYAESVRFLPESIPDEILTPDAAMQWARANAAPYRAPQQEAAPSRQGEAATAEAHATVNAGEEASPLLAPPAPAEAALDALGTPTDAPPAFDPHDDLAHATGHGNAPEVPYRAEGWIPPESQAWGTPADLWGQDVELPTLRPECYPEALRAYIVDEAETMGCDPGMLALYCTAICAGCVTDEIKVQVKAASDRWQEPSRVWLMIVGDSGLTMKSPTLDAAVSHAWKIERELRLAGSQAMKDYATEVQIYEAQKADYVKLRAKGTPAAAPIEPALPQSERLIIGNATLEAIADVLLQQGERGALVLADELIGIIAGMNQYKGGKGADRQDWLEMWNGGPHPIDRKGRAVLIKNWAVSIVGGTQPEAIARIGADLETDGLLQRFSLYLPRHSTHGTDRNPDAHARRRYHEVLDRLTKLTRSPDMAPTRFSPQAYAVITEAREWIFRTAKASWLSAGLRSHLAKWPSMLARLCLTYAAIEAADEHQAAMPPRISEEIALQVWDMMRGTLWKHAEHFYLNTMYGQRPERAGARQIAGLILSANLQEIDARTMTQRSSIFRNAHPMLRRDIIASLCEMGWLNPHGGKSSVTGLPTKYSVNDAVHQAFPHIAEQEREVRAERTKTWNAAKAANREPGSDD